MSKNFNVLEVELNGSKLVEASAGTGKTYSIAILVLRLILERKIPIEKILMVTFTNAAAAELESRIRKFVRLASKYSSGKSINDETIKEVVGDRTDDKKDLLRNAVQNLDNLSVMTIHSFCQKTIDEFTFETNQSFDFEIIDDDKEILKNISIEYFRKVLNVLEPDNFEEMLEKLEFEKLHELLKKHLSGMKFIDTSLDQNSTLERIKNNISNIKNEFDDFILRKFDEILGIQMNRNALKKEAEAGNIEEFKRRFRNQLKSPAKYFPNFEFMKDDFQKFEDDIKSLENELINYFYLDFFNFAEEEINKIRQSKNYISYDEQIKTIHKALRNDSLKAKLSKKYEAVFIDEFQDTDKYQYEIFSEIFSNNSIIFYIGDPKQSIYGWRGADLDTYKQAKRNVNDSVFSMNKNYRSTKAMIDALNKLLNPDDEFNMFMDEEIKYINVDRGAENLGVITENGKEVKPITIWKLEDNDDETNYQAVAQEIFTLLTNNFKIKSRNITPKDIGIIVRDNKEGDAIKKSLTKFNIPSVKRDNAKVLDSDEAKLMKYLLKAVISPNRGDINRALNSPYFGFTTETLKTIDDERHIEIFIGLRKILTEEGVYNMISSFLDEYGVRARCMHDILGQRILTNINQIAEILHKIEKQSKYTPDELLVWMERNSGEMNEEFEQRIESDDEAVQITTIHKAKGLEYNIVFAPYLSMIPKKKLLEKGNVNDFKNNGEYYFTLNYNDLSTDDKNLFDNQKEQENRRLIYVALTRAVYKTYISLVDRTYRKETVSSSLSEITDHYKNDSDLIETIELPKSEFEIIQGNYEPQNGAIEFSPRDKPNIEIKNTFGIHSFSALSKAHHSAPFEKTELGTPEDYDQFIFQDLGRGANVGTALHSIFERLNFANPDSWEQTLEDASKYYRNIIKEECLDLFMQLTKHIMNTEIVCEGEIFTLNRVNNEHKIPELEFCFSMNKVNKTKINEILGEEANLGGEADIEGLMTGFIDLVFEHNGKYYILDWKSNHLGNSVENYDRSGMEEAMKGSNYNLQYMIYTVALKRWLESRLPDFDYDKHFGGVVYVFLRGVRENKNTGIFTAKPTAEVIQKLDSAFKN